MAERIIIIYIKVLLFILVPLTMLSPIPLVWVGVIQNSVRSIACYIAAGLIIVFEPIFISILFIIKDI